MQVLVDTLKGIMAGERDICSNLAALADDKKEYIIKNDLEKIKESIRLEESALKALKDLDKEKVEVLRAIQNQAGLDHPPALSEMIGLSQDETEKKQLRSLQEDFQNLIEDLRFKNNLNQTLLQTQLQYNSFCLKLMTQDSSVGDLYGNTGQVQEASTARLGLLDREA